MRKMVEEADACPETKEIYLEIKKTLNSADVPNWAKALGADPKILKANWEKAKNIFIGGNLPPLLKELIIFKISVENASPYCSSVHAHAALQADKSLTYEDLLRLSKGDELEYLPEPYQVAMEIIPRASKNPQSFTEEDWKKLNDQGFGDNEIMELLAQADTALMFNAITILYDVPIEEGYHAVLDDLAEMP